MVKSSRLVPRFRLALAVSALAALTAMAAPSAGLAAGPQPLVVSPSPVVAPATTVGTKSSFQVTLQNPGELALLENVGLEGADFLDFGIDYFGCGQVPEGGSCSIDLHFLPLSAGTKEATVRLFFDGARPNQTFAISGTGGTASLTLSPTGHDFGVLQPGEISPPFSISLENSGAVPVQPSEIEIGGAGGQQFIVDGSDCGRVLAPATTCSLSVSFAPQEIGEFSGQLHVLAGGEDFVAELKGAAAHPRASSTPNPIAFGPVGVGAPAPTRTVTVTNTGEVPTAFYIASIAGADAGSFRIAGENCTMVTLDPGGSCQVQVSFTPTGTGARTAQLALFGAKEGGLQVQLSGEGVAPALAISAAGFRFAPVVAGRHGASHAFRVANRGLLPAALASVRISGPDLDQFALTGDTCSGTTLIPGAECRVGVRFAPDAAGAASATLRIPGDGTSLAASLRGWATRSVAAAPPTFAWRPLARLISGGSVAQVGRVRCGAAAPCKLIVATRLKLAGELGSIALPNAHATVAAGANQQIEIPLSGRIRALLGSGQAKLVVAARWSSAGLPGGKSGARVRLP